MEQDVVNVIVQELHVFKELEKMTYDLERRPDYSPLSVFRCVDRHNEGKIDTVIKSVLTKVYLSLDWGI